MIKFVYFDLGGVVDLDFSKTNKWDKFKREIGITDRVNEEFEGLWVKFEDEVCRGRSVEDLSPLLKQKFNIKLPNDYSVLRDGFVNRFEINLSIWPVIDEVHKRSRVGLLTNMYPGMYEAIEKRRIIPDVDWNVVIDSSEVGMAKPDPAIFKLAEERVGVKGEEILFVENSPMNVEAAKKFGWQTFLYDPAHPKESSHKLLELYIRLV